MEKLPIVMSQEILVSLSTVPLMHGDVKLTIYNLREVYVLYHFEACYTYIYFFQLELKSDIGQLT